MLNFNNHFISVYFQKGKKNTESPKMPKGAVQIILRTRKRSSSSLIYLLFLLFFSREIHLKAGAATRNYFFPLEKGGQYAVATN
jgi:hypothetical protein